MPLALAAAVKVRLPALMLATETNWPVATALPASFKLPAPGRVVTLTLARALGPPAAAASVGSVKPKSVARNT